MAIIIYKSTWAHGACFLLLKKNISALTVYVQIRHQRNLHQQNGRNAVFEFLVHRLVVPDPHSRPRPYASPNDGQRQKRGFRNAPLGFPGLVFVNAVHDERDGVDGEEISGDAAMQCIHVTFFLLLQFPYDMLDGGNRVIPNHSRPRPAHHLAHSFFHLRSIAVDGTLLASWFVIAKLTAFQSCSSIL